jgi:hypothetical protein
MSCINLMTRFGGRYKITYDLAYSSRHVPKDKLDPAMMQIPCKFGTIYWHGRNTLAVEVDYHPGIAHAVAALQGVTLHQDGDHEKTFLFPVELFNQIAEIVHPRRRRRGNPAAAARLTRYKFKKRT